MKINSITYNTPVSFKRAFTTEEKKSWNKLRSDAAKELNLKETSAIIFDFNVPAKNGENIAMGTMNSKSFAPFVDFLKANAGITKIQAGPQSELDYYSDGKVYYPVTSPYSGATFSLGSHLISPDRLTEDEFCNILDEEFVKSLDDNYTGDKQKREYRTDYGYALGTNKDGAVFQALKTAYQNFSERRKANDPSIKPLSDEFDFFRAASSKAIHNDALFNCIAEEYHQRGDRAYDWKDWDYIDKYLLTDKVSADDRYERITGLLDKFDFYLFALFIADKQHKITKKELNDKGIKLFGDCLVCFSPKEVWANQNCFLEDWYTGGIDPNCKETNNIQPWGAPALNYRDLGYFDEYDPVEQITLGETGELLYDKFKTFMRNYDGVRMDAFWQYVSPFIYTAGYKGYNVEDIDDKIIKIMQLAADEGKDGGFNPEDFTLELIGFNTNKAKALTKNVFPHVYSTAYAEYNENPKDLIEKAGYDDGAFIIGATSHDNDSLVNISRNEERRQKHTPLLKSALKEGWSLLGYNTPAYKSQTADEKIEEDFRNAKLSEIFTTQKQYFTLPDMFGMEERINISGKSSPDNWTVRIPSDYERFYFSQLQNGYGINFAKAYQVALCAKGSKNSKLIESLGKAADILREKGPSTEKEANALDNKGELKNKLFYDA